MMFAKIVFVILMLGALFLSFKFLASSFRVLESPIYHVKAKLSGLELRAYPQMVVVSSEQNMPRKPAIRAGFKALFNYISGHNEKQQVMAMTVPVLQQGQDKKWQTFFIMSAKYELVDLPQPKDKSIKLLTIPQADYLVLRFSGRLTQGNFQRKLSEINALAKQHRCVVDGPAFFAIYNRPWTLSFLRRNEVWLRISGECHLT
jgi:hypothetical protein